MSWRLATRIFAVAVLGSFLSAPSAPPQAEGGQVSFPRFLAKEADAPHDRPLWIDARDVFDPNAQFRRPDLADKLSVASSIHYHLTVVRPEITEGECHGLGVGVAFSDVPPMPIHMVDLEVLAAAIIHGL